MWLKVSPSERSVAERWGANGGETERDQGEERKGKREEDSVCFSVSTHRYILCYVLSLHISPKCQGSGRQGLSAGRDHTCLAVRKPALAVLVGIENSEVTHTADIYNMHCVTKPVNSKLSTAETASSVVESGSIVYL